MANASSRPDLYKSVTDEILAALERGVRPWSQPWHNMTKGPVSRPLRHNGEAYRGINVVLLWMQAITRGYAAPTWMTFRQALLLGGHVRRGETGTRIVFASQLTRSETDAATGVEELQTIPFLKAYTVFNREQIDGLPNEAPHVAFSANADPRPAHVEAFIAKTKAVILHGGDRALLPANR